ncbi:MAG: hypothetical protein KDJ15_07955 [Alphaproteobacteria bacterium]|nr:hypothetical protein [Alphaproteobacteria bacterium]
MAKPRFRPYPQAGTITIANGEEHVIKKGGNFLRVKSADQTFTLRLDDDVELIASVNDVFRLTEEDAFKELTVVNDSGSSLTFQLEIGFGAVDTNSLSIAGTVKTAGGATRTHGVDTVGVAASQLMAQNNDRTGWFVYNNGTVPIYIGSDNTVTTANGTPIPVGGGLGGDDTDEVWAISGTAGQDVRHWEVA